jgi:hypothetical protein
MATTTNSIVMVSQWMTLANAQARLAVAAAGRAAAIAVVTRC